MNCLEFQDLLQQRLDGATVALSADCESHLRQCPTCRALQQSSHALMAGLRLLPAPSLPADFAKRMALLVMDDRRLRVRRRRMHVLVTGALAASLLMMMLAGYFLLPVARNTSTHNGAIAKKHADDKAPVARTDHAPRLDETVNEARHAFASLSERFTANAQKQTKLLLPARPLQIAGIDGNQGPALALEPAAQSLRQAGQAVAGNFEPVANTARRAIAYFVRELPALDKKTAVN